MKALVLCAGLGTRLGEISNGVPKPLIQIGNEPCLIYLLSKLEKIGVKQLIINTHFKPEEFEKSIFRFKTNMTIKLEYEPILLGTAGTLKKHINWLCTDNFWVLHGDNYFDDNLLKMKRKVDETPKNIIGGLGVFRTLNHKKVGIVKRKMNGRVTAIYEKNIKKQGFLANSAVYYLKPDIKNDVVLLDKNQRDISIDLLPKLLNKVIAVTLKGSFIDIGTPQDLIRAKNKSKKFAGVSND